MDENRRFGRRREDEERYGRYEEGFESGGAGRYAQSSEFQGRGSRQGQGSQGSRYGQGRYGQGSYQGGSQSSYGQGRSQGSYGQRSSGQGFYDQGGYGQGSYGQGGYEEGSSGESYSGGGRYDREERGFEGRSFDRSFEEDAWRPGERSGGYGSSSYEGGRDFGPSWRDRSGQQEWSESEGYRGGPPMRQSQGSFSSEQGSPRGFRGGASSRSLGRWGSDRGEGADVGQQRYAGSYGLGYGGQRGGERGESFGAMMGRFFGKGPKGYQRSDERIKEQVSDKLEENGEIDATEITVEVKQGEVTLEGSVADRWMKRMAEDVAEDCAGVKQVHNRLRVEQGNGAETSGSSSSRDSVSFGSSSGSGSTSGATSGSDKSSKSRSTI